VKKVKRRRGFVQNEPFIVLALFGVLCLLMASVGGAAFRLPWYWGLTAGAGFFALGLGAFFLYVHVSMVQEERAAKTKERHQPPPPDA